MSTKAHLAALKAMLIVYFVAAGAAVVAFVAKFSTLGEALISVGVADFILLAIVFLVAPVRCDAPGCRGWMKRNTISESAGLTRLQYECRTCHHIVDTNVRFGASDPW